MQFFMVAMLPLALACGPGGGIGGGGKSTAKPVMKFAYSPPLAWTHNDDTPGAGQSLSEESAQHRINADIEFAVIKAVESYGFSTACVTVENAVKADGPLQILAPGMKCPTPAPTTAAPTTTKAPGGNPPINVVDLGVLLRRRVRQAATPAMYESEGGVVVQKCSDADEFKHEGVTIEITSPVSLPLSSWDNIAAKVWTSLVSDAGVKFYGLIEVSA